VIDAFPPAGRMHVLPGGAAADRSRGGTAHPGDRIHRVNAGRAGHRGGGRTTPQAGPPSPKRGRPCGGTRRRSRRPYPDRVVDRDHTQAISRRNTRRPKAVSRADSAEPGCRRYPTAATHPHRRPTRACYDPGALQTATSRRTLRTSSPPCGCTPATSIPDTDVMCTGPNAAHCPDEQLAWQLYQDHGYRPWVLRPCLSQQRRLRSSPHGQGTSPQSPDRRRLLRLLRRR
jgi:hypothetical protein